MKVTEQQVRDAIERINTAGITAEIRSQLRECLNNASVEQWSKKVIFQVFKDINQSGDQYARAIWSLVNNMRTTFIGPAHLHPNYNREV